MPEAETQAGREAGALAGETARSLLAYVFAEARGMLERSPEQVGASLGMSGRTLRRLESPADEQKPRRSTLQTLAGFYGLDTRFVLALSEWDDAAGSALAERVAELADESRVPDSVETLRALALRLARGSSLRLPGDPNQQLLVPLGAGVPGAEDVPALVDAFVSLDRRRQRLVMTLTDELVAALAHEREREQLGPVYARSER
jgi:transcriptional regulator with XRE-family HTH domain